MFETILLRVFQSVLKTSLGMTPFLIIILLLENRFRKQYSATWKYTLFLLILVRLLVPTYTGIEENLTIGSLVPKTEVTITHYGVQNSDTEKEFYNIEKEIVGIEQKNIPNLPEVATIKMPTPTQNIIPTLPKIQNLYQKNNITFFTELAFIWLFVIIVKCLYLIINYALFYKKVMRWRTAPLQNNTTELYYAVCNDMKIKKIPPLFVCHAIESPMCFGLFHKGIYLTKEDIPQQQLEMIYKHELCHYERKDIKNQLLCILVSTIHFYNPFVTAFVKVVERDIELSCDDMVMENCQKDKRQQYSIMLLSMIKDSKNSVLSNCFSKEGKLIKKRLENILDTSPKKKGTLLSTLLSMLYMLSFCLNMHIATKQLTLLFYLFNLFAIFSFCFLISTKGKKKKTLCAMAALCVAVNTLLIGCNQVIENVESGNIIRAQNYSDEQIEKLLEQKSDYVGYNSAVGNILAEIGTPDGMVSKGFEIQSKAQPYGIKVYFDIEDMSKVEAGEYDGGGSSFAGSDLLIKNDVCFQFEKGSIILFSLIANLEYIDYDISYQNESVLTIHTERKFIDYVTTQHLFPVVLEGYTDSVESYRYFLEYVENLKPKSYYGYVQWQKEIDDALQEIIYNKNVAANSDIQSYIDNAPNDSYNKIIQKGNQALCYFLKRFEEGTARGLRGEIMKRACQDILGKNIVVPNNNNAQQWFEQYSTSYYGKYPLYSSVIEDDKNSDNLLLQNKKQVFTELERELRGRNSSAFIFSNEHIALLDLFLYSSTESNVHKYENQQKINYYGILKSADIQVIEQNRGKVLFFSGESTLPVKITFVKKENEGQVETTLQEIKILRDSDKQTLKTFCAEDKEMENVLSKALKEHTVLNSNIENKLKQYVNKNNIDAKYYCVDHKTLKEF